MIDVILDSAEKEWPYQQESIAKARAELAQFREAINEAREIFENIFKRDWINHKINDKAAAWLAAHPAAQVASFREATSDDRLTFVTYCADCGGAEYHSITCIHRGF